MNADQPKPAVIDKSTLFHKYWKRFLPLWIFPGVFMCVQLMEDFIGIGPLRTAAVILSFIVFLAGFTFASVPYMRREVSSSQMMTLWAPSVGVWILLVIVRGIVFALIGRPL